MNFKDRMQANRIRVNAREPEIKKLAAESREAFMKRESTRMLPYHSFLFSQLLMIKKYWWGVQFLILCAAWYIMATGDAASVIRREVGDTSAPPMSGCRYLRQLFFSKSNLFKQY